MDELRILSLEIQRMQKREMYCFANLNKFALSICKYNLYTRYSTIRGWWLENREVTQNFYNNVLEEKGLLQSSVQQNLRAIIYQHLLPTLCGYLALQRLLSIMRIYAVRILKDERNKCALQSKALIGGIECTHDA